MVMDSLKHWLALKRIEGIGNIGYRNLIDTLKNPQAVFNSPLNILAAIPGISKKNASAIKSFNDWDYVEMEFDKVRRSAATIVTYHDDSYPEALKQIYDFPPFLYVKGALRSDDVNIAVVGSRLASTYGKYTTERLCRDLAHHGVTVVSGLARGIDSAAHRGAIAGRGRTIAVLGCGLDVFYPPENEPLYGEIARNGAVISEFSFGTPPVSSNFPARNRIISGISLGVVVVEATDKSGSLITARIAAEQGREVYAVPGSIDSPGSRGTNKLLKEGAKLVENVDDILDEIRHVIKNGNHDADKGVDKIIETPSPSDKNFELTLDEKMILNGLSSIPVSIDAVIQSTGWNAGRALEVLMKLELKDIVTQLPGKRFKIKT